MERFFAILVLAAVTRASVFQKPETAKFAEECASIHKVSLDVFVPGPKPNDDKIWEDQAYRCYARCMYRKFEAITKEDEIVADKFMSVFEFTDKAKMSECMKTCSAENTQENKCDKAFGTKSCIIKCMRA